MMRTILFLATNLAVMILLGVVAYLLGFTGFISQDGLALGPLLGFCAVFGFGGSFISLAMSKWMAKRATGAEVIDRPMNELEQWLLNTVSRQAERAGIGMPEVAIFPSHTPNAFATGASKNNSLVAVSTGLIEHMNRDEVEAVLGHEIAHIANGDMVTLTLIQGVTNTFVMFFARIVGYVVDSWISGDENNGPGWGYLITTIIMEVVFGALAAIIVAWFSRQREFRADEGGADLTGNAKMIAALQRLKAMSNAAEEELPAQVAAFGIKGGMGKLWSTHPPLDDRISALLNNQ